MAAYRGAVIEPVVWHPVGKAPHIPDAVAARIMATFHEELATRLAKVTPVQTSEACSDCSGMLRVRAAITNIRRSRCYYNVIPMALSFSAAAAGGTLLPVPPPAPGGASEEIEVLDAHTGEILIAISTYSNGMPWNPIGQITPTGMPGSPSTSPRSCWSTR